MNRRFLLLAAVLGWPVAAVAQPAPGPRHDEMLGRDFDQLGPGARERVQNAFREGSPGLDDAAMRQRWNAMTPQQRGETLTARERAQRRAAPQGRGPGDMPTPGTGRGPGPGTRQGPGGGPGGGRGAGPGGGAGQGHGGQGRGGPQR
jgi:translation initiation factor IF-2